MIYVLLSDNNVWRYGMNVNLKRHEYSCFFLFPGHPVYLLFNVLHNLCFNDADHSFRFTSSFVLNHRSEGDV